MASLNYIPRNLWERAYDDFFTVAVSDSIPHLHRVLRELFDNARDVAATLAEIPLSAIDDVKLGYGGEDLHSLPCQRICAVAAEFDLARLDEVVAAGGRRPTFVALLRRLGSWAVAPHA